ncbi:hypothetical protein Tco_1101407 [Tanacetum coccineum]
MSRSLPPIPPSLGTSFSNTSSPNTNRVDMMPTTNDTINTMTTTNVAQSVVDENLPQLLDSRGGSHVTNIPEFDKEDFTMVFHSHTFPNVSSDHDASTVLQSLPQKLQMFKQIPVASLELIKETLVSFETSSLGFEQ